MSDKNGTNGNGQIQFPHSRRIYVEGTRSDIRVPFREIHLNPTRNINNTLEENEPVRVYDSSGPWGDPDSKCTSTDGLPALRREWIVGRGDVEEYEGREILPQDDGYLTENAREYAREKAKFEPYPGLRRMPLRARAGHAVTQIDYARRGIVTPEMEFIAIRENMGRQAAFEAAQNGDRSALNFQHRGESFGAAIPRFVTPE